MAKTKSKAKKSSRTGSNKSANKWSYEWFFVALGVIAVAVIGLLVVRFSNASTVHNYYQNVKTAVGEPDQATTQLTFSGFATLNRIGKFNSGAIKWRSASSGECFTVAYNNSSNPGVFKTLGTKQEIFSPHQSVVLSKKSSCNL